MSNSLFAPLKAEGLTTLKIRYDFRSDKFRFFAAKEWDPDLDFSKYNKTFCVDGIFTDSAVYRNTAEVLAIFREYGLSDYFSEVQDLVRAGKHFGIDCYYYDKFDVKFMMHEHSRKLGLLNKSHSIMAGGIRRHFPEEEERDVIIDGLNLGRGMSFKNVAGNLAFGGCKATVTMEALDVENLEIMGFLAFALDSCRDMTGPDMNFPTEMSDVMIREGYSMQFTGGPGAKTGETGKPTAYGIYLTMKQAVKFREGTDSLAGKTVALAGLGAVGWHMGEHLLSENVKLYVTDINKKTAVDFIARHSGKDVTAIDAGEFLTADVDILCPCATGGIIHEEIIPRIKAKYIWGSANNQLRASSQEEEIRLAKLLAAKDILFQAEWWHNTAGVICGAEEYLYDGTPETLNKKIEETMPLNTWNNLTKAKELGITPTECCYKTCEDKIYG
ncbi:MAG: amino acid dehydrogenase [Clostridiales Family XIII bacterium]|jgi:glutamate dehydrogenase/leucine dehydrogenase|nr:amino acid dehydrogenase [Clostridiales Family XIII bacterium]